MGLQEARGEQVRYRCGGGVMSRIPDDAPVFAMAVVEKMTGLTRRRIRYYEKVGLLEPARTESNRRLYSPSDVRRLAETRRLLEDGLDLQGIAVLLESESRLVRSDRPAPPAGPGVGPGGRATAMEVRALERYEDARTRLTGKGPAGSLDRLHRGDAGRLLGPGSEPRGPVRPGRAAGAAKAQARSEHSPHPPERRR